MDNLTHTLVGAVMGRMGLKRLSPRAMPALIIAANLPDIDSFVARGLGCDPLAAHRGFTHGIGGLVTMPFLAVAIIWCWEKLWPSKSILPRPWGGAGEGVQRTRKNPDESTPSPYPPPQGRGMNYPGLLLACFLGVLSHPLLDLMNTYGTRVLEPFSHRWFYADTLFIVDPWIWVMLILGLEMSWRAERLGRDWRRPAAWAFTAMLLYIGLNDAISARAVALTRPLVERVATPRMIVAGEVPLEFWKREMLWRGDAVGGSGTYDLLDGLNTASLDPRTISLRLDDPRLSAAAARNRHVRAFLFWSRMPMVYVEAGRAYLTDQRFFESGRASSSAFLIPLDKR
ncbi:MAG TPA: metal-dependent hydrolase [Sphingomicrobium sp.]|nr:metal-dependent hydrolase [Sphingomicrobium sp.]